MNGNLVALVFVLSAAAAACARGEETGTPHPDAHDPAADPPGDAEADGVPDLPVDPAVEPEDDAVPDTPPEPADGEDLEAPDDPPVEPDLPLDPDLPADPDAEPDPDLPVDETPAGAGETCATAIDLSALTTWSGDFGSFRNDWRGGSGCGSASGPEAWFTVTVPDGSRLLLEEISGTDVVLERVSSCAATSCAWSSDEPERLDTFNDTGAPVTFTVIVERYYSGAAGPLQLSITLEAPDPGFDCRVPVNLDGLSSWSGSFADYANLWSGGSGCSSASGAEAWFTVTVRGGQRLVLEETSATDVVMHRLTDCAAAACAWSQDEPERFDFFNDTGGDLVLLFVVERYYTGSTGDLQLSISNGAPVPGYSCGAPVDLTSLPSWSGSYTDYSDLWDGGSGCLAASGAEAWFTATVAAGHRLVVEETSATDVVMHRVPSCGGTACSWSSDTTEVYDYFNDTGSAVTVILVVERYYSGSTGPLQLTVSNGPPAPGFTCDVPVDLTSLSSWSGSFTDYADRWDGTSGCLAASGAEAWFAATVPDGNTFTLQETSATDVVIHRVGSCGSTTCTASQDVGDAFTWTNASGGTVTLLIAVERYYSGSTGPLTLTVSIAP